jgi:hypothetical protein
MCFFKPERSVDWSTGKTLVDGIELGGGEKYYQFLQVNFCAHNDCVDNCQPKPMHIIEVRDPFLKSASDSQGVDWHIEEAGPRKD